jgi:hypothetical protein
MFTWSFGCTAPASERDARLEHVDGKLVVVTACGDLERRGLDRRRQIGRQIAQFRVGAGCGMLDEPHRPDESARHAQPGAGEILHGALGLRAPQGIRRHFQCAHTVMLDAIGRWHWALLRFVYDIIVILHSKRTYP